MKFRSTHSVCMQLPDLRKAESFYTGVMGFRLLAKNADHLEYDTGRLSLVIYKGVKARAISPSFSVISADTAKSHLVDNGCEIVEDQGKSLCFKDPFGMTHHVVQD